MTVSLEKKGAVAWLKLNRPEAMNALNYGTLQELEVLLEQVEEDKGIRAIVLAGSGRAFCAGADLKDVTRQVEAGEPDFLDIAARVFTRLRHLPKPVIAAINGLTMAGGLELVLCCDLVIAAESARIGDAHANFGVFPGGGGAAILPRRLPLPLAKLLLFTGDTLTVTELVTYGLINSVVADDALDDSAQALAEKIATKSPLVLARMKRVANTATDKTQGDALKEELLELRDHMRSYDFAEGLRAFAEKRQPEFEGR